MTTRQTQDTYRETGFALPILALDECIIANALIEGVSRDLSNGDASVNLPVLALRI